jgi:hypothetical protein
VSQRSIDNFNRDIVLDQISFDIYNDLAREFFCDGQSIKMSDSDHSGNNSNRIKLEPEPEDIRNKSLQPI